MRHLLTSFLLVPVLAFSQGKFHGGSGGNVSATLLGVIDPTVLSTPNQIGFEAYPNPVQNVLHFSKPTSKEATLFHVNGRSNLVLPVGTREISTQHLEPGLYFLHYGQQLIKILKR